MEDSTTDTKRSEVNKADIIIDLGLATNPHESKDTNFIQLEAKERLDQLIEGFLKKIETMEGNTPDSADFFLLRFHNAIAVNGGRGSGKTTFMLNAKQHITKKKKQNDEGYNGSDIVILPLLDPTLIEDKEHVFISILSRIKKKVDEHYDDSKTETSKKVEDGYRVWNDKLKELSRGLVLLDGIGCEPLKKDCWEDPDYVMEEGLKNASSGSDLERNFHDLIRQSLDLLGKKAFLLCCDDIDTDFGRGWPVLEVLRKYLTSPHLIIIISGDLNLYSKLVRREQWKNLGNKLINNDKEINFCKIVDKLEEQYLLKILKPENRIDLRSVKYYKDKGNGEEYTIKVKYANQEQSITIQGLLRELCTSLFVPINSEAEILRYSDVFLGLPIRTLTQVLIAYTKNSTQQWNITRKSDFCEALGNIFISTLFRYGYNTKAIINISEDIQLGMMAATLTKFDMLEEGYRLKPIFNDDDKNQLMLFLGCCLTKDLSLKSGKFFEYMIKVGLTREVSIRYANKISDYIRFVNLEQQEESIQVSRRHSAFIASPLWGTPNTIQDGLLRALSHSTMKGWGRNTTDRVRYTKHMYGTESPKLTTEKELLTYHNNIDYSKATTTSKQKYLGFDYNSCDSLERNITSWHSIFVPILFSTAKQRNGDNNPFASIFNMLGFIELLINSKSKDIDNVINVYRQVRDFPVYNNNAEEIKQDVNIKKNEWIEETEENNGNEIDDDSEDVVDNKDIVQPTDLDNFKKSFEKWKQQLRNVNLPAYVVAKIWTRFYYTLGNQAEAREIKFIGQGIHRFIVAFLHAILVEEILENNVEDIAIDLRNPTNNDRILSDKIEKVRNSSVPFFDVIANCPIWWLYLNPDSPIWACLSEKAKINAKDIFEVKYKFSKNDNTSFPNLYSLLNSIPLYFNTNTKSKRKTKLEDFLSNDENRDKLYIAFINKNIRTVNDITDKTILKNCLAEAGYEIPKYYGNTFKIDIETIGREVFSLNNQQ